MQYEYPSGAGLKQQIVDGLGIRGILPPDHVDVRSILKDTVRHDHNLIDEFGLALARSSQSSVDAFLERRSEFLKVGKQSIATILIAREHETKLYRKADMTWYDWLWDRLGNGADGFVDHKITVVTFNYDRSLEQYLGMALRDSYALDQNAIKAQMETLKFIHVYGTVGGLPFLDDNARPYQAKHERQHIVEGAKSIKIVDRDKGVVDDPAFGQALEAISQAKNRYFLGFGYDETNLERLEIVGARLGGQDAYGTLYGFTPREALRIRDRVGLSAPTEREIRRAEGMDITMRPTEMDCLEFLRNFAQF